MKLKITFLVFFLCGTIIAQTDTEIKSFINTNKLAIEVIHKTISLNKLIEHSDKLKVVLQKQLFSIEKFKINKHESINSAYQTRLICLNIITNYLKVSSSEFALTEDEKKFIKGYTSLKNIETSLDKEVLNSINNLNVLEVDALNIFKLTVN